MTEHHEDYVAQHTAQELARRLLAVEKKVRRTASAQGDLRHSAIDHGASIPIKDAEGNVTAVLGGHDEPLHYVGGPDPVQPEPPFVDTGGENVKIQHSGFDIYNDRAPANFRRARIYVSRETGFEPGPESFATYMEEADGSVTHRLPGGEWYVGIVWETRSGKLSPMSETVLADVAPLVDAQDIEDTLAEAEQIIADAVAAAQLELDELRDRLDNFEGFDPSDLIAQINQVTDDLATARQEAAGLVSDLADRVDDIKIPDVSGFVTQAEVDAAAAAAETAAKEHADLVAQGAEDNAIAEAEAKANAAREAAELAAKNYTDQQDIETLEAAATDATAKADAAQAAAEAEADRLAKAEAQAAEAEAIRVAAADALAQANAARDAAIESASTDATDKADAAQAAAVAYAEAEAQAKADAAQAEAIRQAAEDATAKANKAREDAEAAANEYADRQDAQVKIDAALDAQEKADAAQAAAEAEADRLAKAEAQAAQTEATRLAAADALEKANAARDAAIATASDDAEAKANAAREAAETYAEAEAQAKADAAQAEAIRQAAEDATAKANAVREIADEAHAEAGRAWDHADTGLNRAISAEANAIEEAGRLATAAREAAEAEADRLAKAEAQAAQAEAIRQAKADALAQAEAARDAAIESSSGDATAKADAAQAAAEEYAEAEAQAKADAAQAEAIRQAALDATAKANAAKTAAENAAKQHADNLPKMLGGSTAPTGTAPNGSIWFRRDSSNTVIGRWERINGSWVQQEVSGQLIDNLEAGKITALNTEFAESVIGKLWTQLAIVDRLVATSAWIGGAMIGNDAVEAKHVVASETLSGKVAEFLKLNVTDLVATGAQVDDAVINKLWVDGLVGLSATLARATVASQSLIPHPLDPDVRDFFQGGDFGINTGDPSIWVQGRYTATSNGTIRLEADQEYRFTVDVAGSVAGTRYYIDLEPQFEASVNFRRVAQDIEAGNKSNWARHEIDFTVADSGDYAVKIWANHTRGTANPDGYQWFRNLKVANKLDGNLVVEDTIRTRHLHVTREMVGEFAKFMHLVVDQMDVNALWADTAWLTAIETASIRLQSVVDSWTTNITGRGMEVISPQGEPTVQLGNFEENGLTLYQDGEATASMTDDGHMSGKYVSANEEFYYQGDELSDILALEHMPRGVVAQAVGTGSQGPWYKETGVAYLQFLTIPGRLYKVTINQRMRSDSTGVYIRLKASHTAGTGSGWPSVSLNNDEIGNALVLMSDGYSFRTVTPEFWWTYPNPDLLASKPTRLLFSVEALSSGDRVNPSSFTFTVEDMGLLPDTTWSYHRGGSDGGAPPEPDPVKPPATKTRRTKTYSMSWWRTWWQNGTVPGSGVGVKEAAQGRTPYFTTAGTYRSMIGFPSMTSDLSGADIEKIEVRVRVIHSHAGSGGNVRLGTHNRTSRPSSYTGYSNAESTNTHFGRGQEKWVTLPSSLYNGFRNGTYRGVTMFTSSTSTTYYVQARPDRFAIRVTYRK